MEISKENNIEVANDDLVRLNNISEAIRNFFDSLINCDNETTNSLPECVTDIFTGITLNLQIIKMNESKSLMRDEDRYLLKKHNEIILNLEKERKKEINIEDSEIENAGEMKKKRKLLDSDKYEQLLKKIIEELEVLERDVLRIIDSKFYINEK